MITSTGRVVSVRYSPAPCGFRTRTVWQVPGCQEGCWSALTAGPLNTPMWRCRLDATEPSLRTESQNRASEPSLKVNAASQTCWFLSFHQHSCKLNWQIREINFFYTTMLKAAGTYERWHMFEGVWSTLKTDITTGDVETVPSRVTLQEQHQTAGNQFIPPLVSGTSQMCSAAGVTSDTRTVTLIYYFRTATFEKKCRKAGL